MASISRRGVLQSGAALVLASAAGKSGFAQSRPNSVVRLDHNENPFGPSPRARAALIDLADSAWKYPYAEVLELRTVIAEHEGVRPECVYVSEGSGELLKLAAMIYGRPGSQIIAARPTFPMLPQYAERCGASVIWVDVDERFGHDFESMTAQVRDATSLIYVCNPNNPTGSLADPAALRAFIGAQSRQALIVVDEAYIDFAPDPGRASVMNLARTGENILITRTFSKLYGLAGLRIGYGVGSVDVIRRLESLRVSFPNRAGVTAARASLGDSAFRAEIRESVKTGIAYTTRLFEEHGIRYVPTHANFMMFETRGPASEFVSFARERGVMVATVAEPFGTWIRVSMGRPDDMRAFGDVLARFVERT